jgi:microsomal dipeptidase-like Zn-dependent dipeptidase
MNSKSERNTSTRRSMLKAMAGAAVIERMKKVGMAVDVSHCGVRTTLDAFLICLNQREILQ